MGSALIHLNRESRHTASGAKLLYEGFEFHKGVLVHGMLQAAGGLVCGGFIQFQVFEQKVPEHVVAGGNFFGDFLPLGVRVTNP